MNDNVTGQALISIIVLLFIVGSVSILYSIIFEVPRYYHSIRPKQKPLVQKDADNFFDPIIDEDLLEDEES
tara:strand:- start:486 stop:698 length:213 start_codon:yes stop_codon:yes gene_type:complete